jgi:hypothetical protein
MTPIKTIIIGAGLIGVLLLAFFFYPPINSKNQNPAPESKEGIVREAVSWQLSNARVVEKGSTSKTKGILINNLVIEADVSGDRNTSITSGKFRIRLRVASSAQNPPAPSKRVWHVRGVWTITETGDSGVSRVTEKSGGPLARRAPRFHRGTLAAELPFDPTLEQGPVEAQVRVLDPRPTSQSDLGQGVFRGNEKLEGNMQINLEFLPPPPKPRDPHKGAFKREMPEMDEMDDEVGDGDQ